MAEDFRRWLDGVRIRARPVGPLERTWRFGRRHPRVAALAMALALATTAGVAGILWQWRRAEADAREANGYLRKNLDSIDAYFTQVSENRLLDVPNLQPLRRELLTAASGHYEALLRDRPGELAIRLESAKARSRLAAVVAVVGRSEEAFGLFRQSLAKLDRLVEESPGAIGPRVARLTCPINLAKVQMLRSRYDDGRSTCRRLLAEADALRGLRPDAVEALQAGYAARPGLGLLLPSRRARRRDPGLRGGPTDRRPAPRPRPGESRLPAEHLPDRGDAGDRLQESWPDRRLPRDARPQLSGDNRGSSLPGPIRRITDSPWPATSASWACCR